MLYKKYDRTENPVTQHNPSCQAGTVQNEGWEKEVVMTGESVPEPASHMELTAVYKCISKHHLFSGADSARQQMRVWRAQDGLRQETIPRACHQIFLFTGDPALLKHKEIPLAHEIDSFPLLTYNRVSQLQHQWHLRLDNPLLWGAVLTTLGCLVALLTSLPARFQ